MNQHRNIGHIRAIRDTVREAVNQFVLQNKLGHAMDAATGIALALSDLIKEAPDSNVRERLAHSVVSAITTVGHGRVVVPRSMQQ